MNSKKTQKDETTKKIIPDATQFEPSLWEKIISSIFEIGGEDQIERIKSEFSTEPSDEEGKNSLKLLWEDSLKTTKIQIGTLLKTDNVSFLFGAGASKYSGGLLLGSIPIVIETELLQDGIKDRKVNNWLRFFYQILLAESLSNKELPTTDKEILERKACRGSELVRQKWGKN